MIGADDLKIQSRADGLYRNDKSKESGNNSVSCSQIKSSYPFCPGAYLSLLSEAVIILFLLALVVFHSSLIVYLSTTYFI